MTSTSSEKSEEYPDYKKALEVCKDYNEPSIGFYKLQEPFAIATEVKNVVRQNNTIIELLIGIHKKLDALKSTSTPTSEIDKITQKLEKLTISKPTPKKGPFYVFKDPKRIFEEEKEKLKRATTS